MSAVFVFISKRIYVEVDRDEMEDIDGDISYREVKGMAIAAVTYAVVRLSEEIIADAVKSIKECKEKIITQNDLNKFINDFKSRKLDFLAMGMDLVDEVISILETVEVSGEGTIIMIILVVLLFISRFVYEHFVQLFLIPVILIVFLLNILYKLSGQVRVGRQPSQW